MYEIEPENVVLKKPGVCTKCVQEIANAVCIKCKKVLCSNCSCSHGTEYIKTLNRNGKGFFSKTFEQRESTVEFSYPIQLPQDMFDTEIRICGIASLSNYFVVADRCNKTLLVYENEKFSFHTFLEGREPKAISKLHGNKIAITMPYDNQIWLYKIQKDRIEVTNRITLSNNCFERPIGRPYSITSDNHHLAIETGIGDDGVILVIDEKGNIKKKIPNKNHFGYFTGNTLRLALDWNHQKVYVSALSKKTVFCIDFEGNIQWNTSMISPRDVIKMEVNNEQKLLLSSKRMDTIYILDPSNGRNKPLICGEKLVDPQFIAYNNEKQILYVNQGYTIMLYKLMLN